jgi:hypothetical protein
MQRPAAGCGAPCPGPIQREKETAAPYFGGSEAHKLLAPPPSLFLSRRWHTHTTIKILPRTSVQSISMSVRPCVRVSDKWLVGPSSTSNRATSFFISLGDTRRCYGVLLCRADASDQRRARCWLPFFGVTGRNASFQETSQNMLARC